MDVKIGTCRQVGQVKLASRGHVPEPARNECTGSAVLDSASKRIDRRIEYSNSQWQPSIKAVERSVASACGRAPRQPKTSLNDRESVTSELCCAALESSLDNFRAKEK